MARATGSSEPSACAARRGVILGIGGVGLVALAGCGSAEDPYADPGGPEDLFPRSTGPSAGSRPAGVAGSADEAGAGQGSTRPSLDPFPGAQDGTAGLVKTADVPVGGAVAAGELLVTQPRRGVFKGVQRDLPASGSDGRSAGR